MADESSYGTNVTHTVFAADTIPTEQVEEAADNIAAGRNGPPTFQPRSSLAMKKPSIDFNAMAPNFLNKISQGAAI